MNSTTRTEPGFLVSTFEEEISMLKMYFANQWDLTDFLISGS
jgi:hypothetical protein